MAKKKTKKKTVKVSMKRKCGTCGKRGHNTRTCGRYK
jgi:hypothetical protein